MAATTQAPLEQQEILEALVAVDHQPLVAVQVIRRALAQVRVIVEDPEALEVDPSALLAVAVVQVPLGLTQVTLLLEMAEQEYKAASLAPLYSMLVVAVEVDTPLEQHQREVAALVVKEATVEMVEMPQSTLVAVVEEVVEHRAAGLIVEETAVLE